MDIKHKYSFLFILFQKNKIYNVNEMFIGSKRKILKVQHALFHIILSIECFPFSVLLAGTRTLFWFHVFFYQFVNAPLWGRIVSMRWNPMNPAIKTSRTRKHLEYSWVYRSLWNIFLLEYTLYRWMQRFRWRVND